MTVKRHAEQGEQPCSHRTRREHLQRVIPNEVRDPACEVYVSLRRQRKQSSCESSLATLGMTAAKQMLTRKFSRVLDEISGILR
jgi:hypothetical protein